MALQSAVHRVSSTGMSIVSLRNQGFPMFCICLTTGAVLVLREITVFERQMELKQFCDGLLLLLQFHVCVCV